MALEGKVKTHDELMIGKGENVTFCLGVPNQVLGKDFVFLKNFHGIVLI